MAEEPETLELPAAGDTSPPPWRTSTTESPGTVSMAEALDLWQLSERTLRRRLVAGEVAGAHKVPSQKGEEWRIPADALDALGFARVSEPEPATPSAPAVEVEELLQELREDRQAWRDLATETRKELTAAESSRVSALTEAARLEERLAAVERERDAAIARAAEAEAALTRRRRWGRGKPSTPS